MGKIIIEQIDWTGITLDKFELIPSKKGLISRSRVFIKTEDGKVLGYFIVYDDETIKFVNKIID